MVISKPLSTRADGLASQTAKPQRASARNLAAGFSAVLAGVSGGAPGLPLPENGGRIPIPLNQAQLGLLQAGQARAGQAGGQNYALPGLDRVLENSARPLGILNSAQELLRAAADDNILTANLLGVAGLQRPDGLAGAETNVRVNSHRAKPGVTAAVRSGKAQAQAHIARADTSAWFSPAREDGDDSLGALAAQFESGRDGIAAIGYDRHGGTSYGKYQLSSRAGTMRGFIEYLKTEEPAWATRLEEAGAANTGSRRGKMPEVWKQIAGESPGRFEQLQEKFIHRSHFVPAMEAVAEQTGLSFNDMPAALQEVLFSTAVQHGPGGAARIVSRAVGAVGQDTLNPETSTPEALRKTGENLIRRIYALRSGQFGSSTAAVQTAVKSRLKQEMSLAINMLRTETAHVA